MRPTIQEIEATEAFFKTKEIPKEIQLNKSTRQLDVPKYLGETFEMAKDPDVVDLIVNSRWESVIQIKEILMRQ